MYKLFKLVGQLSIVGLFIWVITIDQNRRDEMVEALTFFETTTNYSSCFLQQTNVQAISFKDYARLEAEEIGINWKNYECLINCESQWNPDAKGDEGLAFGLLQYHFPTFKNFCKGDYTDSYAQIDCSLQMLKSNKGHHWKICYSKCFLNI